MKVSRKWLRILLCVAALLLFHYVLSVLELQPIAQQDLHPRKSHSKKFDHLVLGPAAGEGLADRLHCQGTKALNKTHFSTSSSSSNGEHITFVTLFATYNSSVDSSVSDLVTVGNTSYSKLERSLVVLNVFINFIQMTMPHSNIVILSDPSSELPVHRVGVTVHPIQLEYSRDKLMLQRIRSYISFLESKLEEHSQKQELVNHYILTDSDAAVVDNLGDIFLDYLDFDVALTFRNNKEQPLNSGFIAVRGSAEAIKRAMAFLQKVLEIYAAKYMKASRMLGDQLALAWTVKSEPLFDEKKFKYRQPFLDNIGGASVLFLPCSTYNWTPPEGAGQFHGMPLDVKVVHFKGSRKRLMLEAWNSLSSSSSSDISDMLCLVLKSGRTKYDF